MTLRIALVAEAGSWIRPHVTELASAWRAAGHDVVEVDAPSYGAVDMAFFLSYGRIVPPAELANARHNMVVHGSALPAGRGWSPWSWEILAGKKSLALSLIEAAERVDTGRIYDQRWVDLEGHELINEWQQRQAEVLVAMCRDFVAGYPGTLDQAREQQGDASYYPRRRRGDSRLDPERSLAEQFGLLRIVDNERYPAFFDHAGHRYVLSIRKADDQGGRS